MAQREPVEGDYMNRCADAARPETVEAIMDGRQPATLQLDDLLAGFPLEWEEQRRLGPSVSEPKY